MDNLTSQVLELSLIGSMYPEQLKFFDPVLQEIITSADPLELLTKRRKFLVEEDLIEFVFDQTKYEINFKLPSNYPDDGLIEAHLRLLDTSILNSVLRKVQVHANQQLTQFINDEDANILSVINWASDFVDNIQLDSVDLLKEKSAQNDSKLQADCDRNRKSSLCRQWIYSHHIYSTGKRKLIQELCHSLDLTGFSRPGKPGFICVEGQVDDVNEFWLRIRFENWQRITVIAKELDGESEHVDGALEQSSGHLSTGSSSSSCDSSRIRRIFDKFQELPLDQSDFIRFLEEKKCSNVIREYLGWNSTIE
ncbi:RWD domain-containing protein 2B [Halotydeus destructor]|nr:RWD domain-containing protein 2B [Halotydeus destructor]